MEGDNSTNDELTNEELRNAGASALFVAYYNEAPTGASARVEVESGPFSLDELADDPYLGGGFFAALWNGDEMRAVSGADGKNLPIMEEVLGREKAEILGW